jgi:hypothetical protein
MNRIKQTIVYRRSDWPTFWEQVDLMCQTIGCLIDGKSS